MDVIVEGKITQDEPIAEVIQTLIDLKNYPHLVLRVTDTSGDLEGRIAFSHGAYILGGRINHTDDTGYKAIHRLLSIKDGNYAILDPGKQQIADINQTLWIISERVIERLPELPDTPVDLFDASKDGFAESTESLGAGAAVLQGLGYGRFETKEKPEVEKPTISNLKSKARSFNENFWYFVQWTCVLLFCLAIGGGFALIFQFHGQLRKEPPKNAFEYKKPSDRLLTEPGK